jgi:hypothetical protein
MSNNCLECGKPIKVGSYCSACVHAGEDIDDEAGEREYMRAESKNRDLTEDERIIYNIWD